MIRRLLLVSGLVTCLGILAYLVAFPPPWRHSRITYNTYLQFKETMTERTKWERDKGLLGTPLVVEGMSKTDVEAILGKPNRVDRFDDWLVIENWDGDNCLILVRFEDGIATDSDFDYHRPSPPSWIERLRAWARQ
jgi:hypothetical protein